MTKTHLTGCGDKTPIGKKPKVKRQHKPNLDSETADPGLNLTIDKTFNQFFFQITLLAASFW